MCMLHECVRALDGRNSSCVFLHEIALCKVIRHCFGISLSIHKHQCILQISAMNATVELQNKKNASFTLSHETNSIKHNINDDDFHITINDQHLITGSVWLLFSLHTSSPFCKCISISILIKCHTFYRDAEKKTSAECTHTHTHTQI